jgi:putative DNA modification/repair radical SAM protein
MRQESLDKLKILANAAKYDVSCASSGSKRPNTGKGIGNTTPWGICHSFAEDGRCISLFKIMLTNHCINDCAYCINRRSNDIPRTTFTVSELVELTLEFYRRNYIEGLFLSSGVIKNADYTMERMIRVAKDLRTLHQYNGYIHLKSIPGASVELISEAGLYADRLSVNIEIPSEQNLKMLAPEKNYRQILQPMGQIRQGILQSREQRKLNRNTRKYTPAGQSTQMIIGATPETDKEVMMMASSLYKCYNLKRVYYSGFIPVNAYDKRLPVVEEPPLVREHRLYQADWLFRFYEFSMEEIVNEKHPNLELEIDPKLSYALRNPQLFPVDINKADYQMILRVPGIGPRSAQLIATSRKYQRLTSEHLKKMGVVMKRAKYFITCGELQPYYVRELKPENLRKLFTGQVKRPESNGQGVQLKLF